MAAMASLRAHRRLWRQQRWPYSELKVGSEDSFLKALGLPMPIKQATSVLKPICERSLPPEPA